MEVQPNKAEVLYRVLRRGSELTGGPVNERLGEILDLPKDISRGHDVSPAPLSPRSRRAVPRK